jgi:mono/diheme cytochrome c family protein
MTSARAPRGAALLLLLGLTACPRLDPMQRQPKYRAYQAAAGAGAAGGGVQPAMREPPAGTVPFAPLPDAGLATGLGPDGRPLERAPMPATAATLARGRQRFEVFCAACHGVLGDGESQVALNMALRRPPSLHAYRDVPDGHIFRVLTNGFGLMPSYAAELPLLEDRWAVVHYVRALQLSQHAALEQVPPDARQRLLEEGR